ncbi:Type IV secretion protein Rhs, partial [Kibdelosporangium sp. 4NS15]
MRVRALLIKATTLATALMVTATSVTAIALPAQGDPSAPAVQKERNITGQPVKVNPLPNMAMPKEPVKPVVWPAVEKSEVDTRGRAAPQQVGQSPVAVSAQRDVKVAVETLGQDASAKAGVAGTMLKVSTASKGETTTVRLNYSGFGHAYGDDYGSRLTFQRYPACVLTTPDKPECKVATPLPTKNDARRMELTADVPAVSQEGTVIAAAAAAAGSAGDYSASSLAPSGSWSAGDSSGDFTYSVPVTLPAAPGGPAPQLAFAYSAGSVDGRTSATNNQASWVGEGWELSTGGFMERSYTACEIDKAGSNQGDKKTGDMCWKDERYTISLGGMSGKLIKGSNGLLRPEKDDGSKIEKIGGFTDGYQGEHWKVTTIDGTQYFLGLNRLPGWTAESGKAETTNSVLTMPVYGNHAGEPCNKPAYADSMCMQAYRWNVDLVIDPRGNAMAFYYDKETNFYQRNGFRGVNTQYDASNRLARIEYGLRENALMAKPPAQVVFHTAERCLPSGVITCDPGQLTKDTAVHWPDVPFDRICNAGEDCTDRYSPAFFTRKRLTKVVTQSLRQDGSGFDDVDSWSLRQEFPPTVDGSPKSLWLSGVTRAGHVGGTVTLPEVTFAGNPLPNRVDTSDDTVVPITRYRLTRIVNEAGGLTEAEYLPGECTPTNLPTPHDNKMRCYPVFWNKPGHQDLTLDWFHKYVVRAVTEDARTGGPSKTKSEFQYFTDNLAMWHYDSNDLAEAKHRTWSEWRGYPRVRTIKGDDRETRSVSEKVYLRGMDADFQPNGMPPRDVWVEDFGGRVEDVDQLSGFVRENRLISGDRVVSASVNEPHLIETANDGKDRAVMLLSKWTLERSLQGDGTTWRQTRSSSQYNNMGLAERTEDEGDLAVSGDESCTEKQYLRNEAKWMFTYISSVRSIAKPCSAWPGTDDDITTFVQSAFDGQKPLMAPTRGIVTSSFRWNGTGAFQRVESTIADEYGRTIESTDADGGKTQVIYTPATGNPHTVTTINRAGWETKSLLDTARGAALTEFGLNGERSDLEYDPLGRLVKVWKPGRSKLGNQSPNAEYSYEYRKDAPTVVTSKSLKENEQYTTSYNLLDGMLRSRQTQTPSPIGGRILTDTFYDSRGNANVVNNAYYNKDEPSTELFGAQGNAVPNQTVTEFDDLGRPLETIQKVMDVEQWRTKTRYSGDITYTTPPEGATATAVIKNALGAIVERRDYHQRSTDGLYRPSAPYDATKYSYDAKGKLSKVVDVQGNTWEYKYDRLGRKNWSSDPDTGVSTYEYDVMDQLKSTTDARGRKLVYDYDDLGRVTTTSEEVNGVKTKLTETVFDTLRKGLPTSSTRYVGGNAYVQQVDRYDSLNRPDYVSVVIPAVEGKLAGTYQYRTSYSAVTGLVQSEELPAVGGLPRESIHRTYNEFDLPLTTNGLSRLASEHTYSAYGETLRLTHGESPRKVWINNIYTEGTRRLHNTQVKTGGDPEMIESDRTYTYDPAGNITKMTQAGAFAAETQCFTYDYLRRMTSAWTPRSGDCAAQKSVAGLGGPGPYWHDFTYDRIGNRATQV